MGTQTSRSRIVPLVLAVVASLPALIFIIVVAEPTLLTLNRELLALEVVRTLVGSIGIILAMPLTTFLAALAFGDRGARTEPRQGRP